GRQVPSRIAKFPDQFLLFGVDRDDRIIGLDVRLYQSVDVAKLLIARGVLGTFFGLSVRLQRIAQLGETTADGDGVHAVASSRPVLPRSSVSTCSSTATSSLDRCIIGRVARSMRATARNTSFR